MKHIAIAAILGVTILGTVGIATSAHTLNKEIQCRAMLPECGVDPSSALRISE